MYSIDTRSRRTELATEQNLNFNGALHGVGWGGVPGILAQGQCTDHALWGRHGSQTASRSNPSALLLQTAKMMICRERSDKFRRLKIHGETHSSEHSSMRVQSLWPVSALARCGDHRRAVAVKVSDRRGKNAARRSR